MDREALQRENKALHPGQGDVVDGRRPAVKRRDGSVGNERSPGLAAKLPETKASPRE